MKNQALFSSKDKKIKLSSAAIFVGSSRVKNFYKLCHFHVQQTLVTNISSIESLQRFCFTTVSDLLQLNSFYNVPLSP